MGAEEEQRQQQQPKSSSCPGTEPPHADAKGEKRISYFDFFFLKKNPCCFFFLTFYSNCAPSKCEELLLQHHESMHKRNFQNKEKNVLYRVPCVMYSVFFAQSNYTNMSENSQEKNPKNQTRHARVSNNSLFFPSDI